MFKIGRIGTVSLDVLKGISYKLGFLKIKPTEVTELQKTTELVDVAGYQYPHQQEELQKEVREIYRGIEEAKAKYRTPII